MAEQTIRYDNGDVSFKLEYNFSLDEWEKKLTTQLEKDFIREADKYLHNMLAKRFLEQRGPSGRGWKKLSPITINKKGHRRKLFLTGDLLSSFKTSFSKGIIVVSTDVSYARIQQEGAMFMTTRKQSAWMWANLFNREGPKFVSRRVVIPARPFFGFNRRNISDLKNIMRKLVLESESVGK
jgi:phage gpG-like protein